MKKVEMELWQRRDYNDGSGTSRWHKDGLRLTGLPRVLQTTAAAYRAFTYQETGQWWEFEFREIPKPICSRDNVILREFRGTLEGIIDPNISREAGWWLQLMEWDPEMESEWYWGEYLAYSATEDHREDAKRVLTRLRDAGRWYAK